MIPGKYTTLPILYVCVCVRISIILYSIILELVDIMIYIVHCYHIHIIVYYPMSTPTSSPLKRSIPSGIHEDESPTKKAKSSLPKRIPLKLVNFLNPSRQNTDVGVNEDDVHLDLCIIYGKKTPGDRIFRLTSNFDYGKKDREFHGPMECTTELMMELIETELKTSLPHGVSYVISDFIGRTVLSIAWKDRAYAFDAMSIVLQFAPGILTQTRLQIDVDKAYIDSRFDGKLTPTSLEYSLIDSFYKHSTENAIDMYTEGIRPTATKLTLGYRIECMRHPSAWTTKEGKRLACYLFKLKHGSYYDEEENKDDLSSDEEMEEKNMY